MTFSFPRLALAAFGLLACLGTTADAQQLPIPGIPGMPRVVTWPGGYMTMNGTDVVVRHGVPGWPSPNLVAGTVNGFGSRVVVGNGFAGGVALGSNGTTSFGRGVVVDLDSVTVALDDPFGDLGPVVVRPGSVVVPGLPTVRIPAVPAPPASPQAPPVTAPPAGTPPMVALPPADPNGTAAPSYKGKDSPFWSTKQFSDQYDCNLYWCPTTRLWFRYGAEDDTYRPVPVQPAAPAG
jgi:hypothetical protein